MSPKSRPQPSQPSWGFYLQGRRNKKATPIENTRNKHAPDSHPEKLDPKKDIPDKIYFFNHVLVTFGSIETMDPVHVPHEQSRVAELMKQHPAKGDQQLLERIGSLQENFASVPLPQQNGTVTAVLPLSNFPNSGKPVSGTVG